MAKTLRIVSIYIHTYVHTYIHTVLKRSSGVSWAVIDEGKTLLIMHVHTHTHTYIHTVLKRSSGVSWAVIDEGKTLLVTDTKYTEGMYFFDGEKRQGTYAAVSYSKVRVCVCM